MHCLWIRFFFALGFGCLFCFEAAYGERDRGERDRGEHDHLRQLQTTAIADGKHPVAHWGWDPENYLKWSTHTNRLIPVYTYGTKNRGEGVDLDSYLGVNSCYRSAEKLKAIFYRLPKQTLKASSEHMDQTDIYRLQMAAVKAGKKFIFLVVFDGMDWHTTRATSIYNLQRVSYDQGRGRGTHFQDYMADGTSQYGWMVTSPFSTGATVNEDDQTISAAASEDQKLGGYDSRRCGAHPWEAASDAEYPVGGPKSGPILHAYTDSSSSATSMMAGIKTYNGSVNISPDGERAETIAQHVQRLGWSVAAVSNVPVSHATPAAAYAHNVSRSDNQDIARDLLGLPSISHPEPLPGMDVLLGAGFGVERDLDDGQGDNFVAGNPFLAEADLELADYANGGKYVVATRSAGRDGSEILFRAAKSAAENGHRLLGLFGIAEAHLPFQTANGDYQTAPGRKRTNEIYSSEDVFENPTLAEMTEAALIVLKQRNQPFWMLVEPGDVDWCSHDNNLDNVIGAVNSGDAAVRTITDWVEKHSSWEESLLIVTSDHGHYLQITEPEGLITPPPTSESEPATRSSDELAPVP